LVFFRALFRTYGTIYRLGSLVDYRLLITDY
jgi:hypothetical protein